MVIYPSFRRRTDRVTCRCGREEALSFAVGTCGRGGRGEESGGARISAGQASPFPGFAGSVWVRHASSDNACPRKVRQRFSDKAQAKTLCSEAVSAPEGGRPPPKNAWGRAKAKPHKHITPEATLSRGSPDGSKPACKAGGTACHARTSDALAFCKEPCYGAPTAVGDRI